MRNQNLQPWTKGTSGNPNGRPKGSRNVSTLIRDIMENAPKWSMVPVYDTSQLEKIYQSKSAWEAVIYVAFAHALKGDIKAMDWLSKNGYGDRSNIGRDEVLGNASIALVEFTSRADTDG